jgi:hypothetical protein
MMPDMNPDHAKALVDFVKEESKKFHPQSQKV